LVIVPPWLAYEEASGVTTPVAFEIDSMNMPAYV
jgi:hypothetical protein